MGSGCYWKKLPEADQGGLGWLVVGGGLLGVEKGVGNNAGPSMWGL
jgi:hypothetical protein